MVAFIGKVSSVFFLFIKIDFLNWDCLFSAKKHLFCKILILCVIALGISF